MASKKRDQGPGSDRPTPSDAGQRISALDERLAELRTKLAERTSVTPASGTGAGSDGSARTAVRTGDLESLALLVFNALGGDHAKLRLFVHLLGRLEAKRKPPAQDPNADGSP